MRRNRTTAIAEFANDKEKVHHGSADEVGPEVRYKKLIIVDSE